MAGRIILRMRTFAAHDWVYIAGRGWVAVVRLPEGESLTGLAGAEVSIDGEAYAVTGTESTDPMPGRLFGLLIRGKPRLSRAAALEIADKQLTGIIASGDEMVFSEAGGDQDKIVAAALRARERIADKLLAEIAA